MRVPGAGRRRAVPSLALALGAATATIAAAAVQSLDASEEALAPGQGGDDDACDAGGGHDCSLRLLQRRALRTAAERSAAAPAAASGSAPAPRPRQFGKQRADVLAGRSVYFVVIDRFARSDGDATPCNDAKHWCGGNLRGIVDHLDYIAGMHFDTLWITPVVKQYEGETQDGTGFMGYWAKDHYQIDPHYGTPQDLKDLVRGLHERNMTLMLDIVVNHVGPVHSSRDVLDLNPFNKVEYFHTLGIGDETFDEYAAPAGKIKGAGNRPVQAMWSGAQCPIFESCNCFACTPVTQSDMFDLPPPAWDACPFGKMVWNASSPCPWDSLSAFCMPGDYGCAGYSEQVTLDGWFYDLGDLNQSVPFVRQGLLNWTRWMVETYDIDMLRLDTAGFVPFAFLSELQEAAGVPIIGEVTATNMSYHAGIQRSGGRPGIDGVLNFPLYYTAEAAFCHTWFPHATGNLTFLGERAREQAQPGLYTNLDTLGNFIDNHDVDRLKKTCKADAARVVNALTWVMLTKGVPIVYYGSEVPWITEQRESMWNYNFSHTYGWHWLGVMNKLRRDLDLGTASQTIMTFVTHQQLAFTRGDDHRVWVYLNNMESGDEVVRYCGNLPQPPEEGYVWTDIFAGQPMKVDSDGCLRARDNIPLILVQRSLQDIMNKNVRGFVEVYGDKAPSGETVTPGKVYHHTG